MQEQLSWIIPALFLILGVTMIKYTDFNFPQKVKPTYKKQCFTLNLEQLSFLFLLSEKFNLTDDELKLFEFLVYNQCKAISLNRFRQLNYEAVCLASVLYMFDLKNRDYTIILDFIDLVHPDKFQAGSIRSKTYNIYRNLCNCYFAVNIQPEYYESMDNALKLKK